MPMQARRRIGSGLMSLLFLVLGLALGSNGFAASPRINYLLYCSGCHLPGGQGNAPNVPTLHDELGLMMTVPAMRGYLARVPGSAQAPIDDVDLTAVLNWLLTEFNSETLPEDFKPLSVDEVSAARARLLADPNGYRETHWKPYDFQTPLTEHQ